MRYSFDRETPLAATLRCLTGFGYSTDFQLVELTFSGVVSIAAVSITCLGQYVYPQQRDPKRAALVASASA
ncbi:hypothetical protein [Paraburkholderia sp. BL18I3N2]|uniref:hypothetical protein n=1 Tax=Paraburkholderia sp. BL18I3N2 TaxID=1938799 RepID=UPI000D04839A|nr:hypothetical protein [Paraburkholderia sp. BL18I3N2]